MVATTCTFFPEREDEEQNPLGLAFVPIYLVHTIEQPFCSNSHCFCQQQRPRKSDLLGKAKHAELRMQPAFLFQRKGEVR